jgi:hypothetical protein
MVRPVRALSDFASSITWASVGTRYRPSYALERPARDCTARNVLISASVKSLAK